MDPSVTFSLIAIAILISMSIWWFFLYGMKRRCSHCGIEKDVEIESNGSNTSSTPVNRNRLTRSGPVITADYVSSPPPSYQVSHLYSYPVITTAMDESSYLPTYDQAISFNHNLTSINDYNTTNDMKEPDHTVSIALRDL